MFRLTPMLFPRVLALGALLAAPAARAVYAPIPEQEQGRNLTISLRAGASYDSNLFGAATGEVDSAILTFAPKGVYNASLTDQTFLSASYGLALDYFTERPGNKLLDSHELSLRVAHAFTQSTTIDVFNLFMLSRNPESLLAGVPLNPDQSFYRNQIDARFNTPLTAKLELNVKARSVYSKYRNPTLGRSLDRIENIYGLSGEYAALPEVKLVAEARHQDVFYRKEGEFKNKRSEFLMGGVDYAVAKKFSTSGRLGAEWRKRVTERSTTVPYAEFSGKFDYGRESFLLGGYAYTLEETSNTARFTDSQVHRLFVSLQHHLTTLMVASGSLTYEPTQLQGRRGVANVDEITVRGGGALSYLVTKNWTLSASYDFDRVRSDDAARNMLRHRAGVSANYAFGVQ